MSLRGDAVLYALAVGAFITLPAKIAFLLIGVGGVVGGVTLLPSQPKYAIALLLGGVSFVTLGIRAVIMERRQAERQAEAAANAVRRRKGH